MSLRSYLGGLARLIWSWAKAQVARYYAPRRPSKPSATLLRKDGAMNVYALKLGASPAPVASHKLNQVVNGQALDPIDATDGMELRYNEGDTVALTQVDVSAAGLASEPSDEFVFTATAPVQDQPPARPGAPSVTFLRAE